MNPRRSDNETREALLQLHRSTHEKGSGSIQPWVLEEGLQPGHLIIKYLLPVRTKLGDAALDYENNTGILYQQALGIMHIGKVAGKWQEITFENKKGNESDTQYLNRIYRGNLAPFTIETLGHNNTELREMVNAIGFKPVSETQPGRKLLIDAQLVSQAVQGSVHRPVDLGSALDRKAASRNLTEATPVTGKLNVDRDAPVIGFGPPKKPQSAQPTSSASGAVQASPPQQTTQHGSTSARDLNMTKPASLASSTPVRDPINLLSSLLEMTYPNTNLLDERVGNAISQLQLDIKILPDKQLQNVILNLVLAAHVYGSEKAKDYIKNMMQQPKTDLNQRAMEIMAKEIVKRPEAKKELVDKTKVKPSKSFAEEMKTQEAALKAETKAAKRLK